MQLRAIALFLLGLAVGLFAGPLFRDRVPQNDSSASSEQGELVSGLQRELSLLRRSIEERPEREELTAPITREPEAVSDTDRQPLQGPTTSNEEILAAIRALEAKLVSDERDGAELEEGTIPLSSEELLERMKDPTRGIDWAAWDPIVNLWHQDKNEARKAVKLLTDEQVLERFGPPTDVWSNAQGITWQYARDWDPVRKKFGTDIILRIPDGYVTQLAVR